jgi:biotin/methionine sulfoxide reductase
MLRAFREQPELKPLPTPSGKLQVSSPVVASFGYADCPGHPAWLAPTEPPNAQYPLWLISNQPHTKLHSQLDFGAHSQASKRRGREVCTMHPHAAAARGIREGDIVRVFNARGACLACVTLSDGMLPNVVQLPTGAWYDPVRGPDGELMCGHGNPNMLTRDIGTSSLAQGCTGQLTVAQVERYDAELPPIRCHEPPPGA